MSQQDAGVGINVWPWVLGFSGLEEDIWSDLVNLANQLEQRVAWQMLEGKFTLSGISWVLNMDD